MAKLTKFHAGYFKADPELEEIFFAGEHKGFKSMNGAINCARTRKAKGKGDLEALHVKREDVADLLDQMAKDDKEAADKAIADKIVADQAAAPAANAKKK